MSDDILLEVKGLKTYFFLDEGIVKAVDGVDFEVKRGKTIGVVGESGCGKSVTAFSILQLVGPPGKIADGQILLHKANSDEDGLSESSEIIDIAALRPDSSRLLDVRGNEIAMIFQEPMTSLSMSYTVGDQITEAIHLHFDMSDDEARQRAIEMLGRVGIPNPEARIDNYPFQLSGGMRQRAMIAMALSCNPSLLIADEPTTALDVTTQAQILELMHELQRDFGMAIMMITHDLGVVAEICDDVVVMYLGEIVEQADVDSLFHDPLHPYTRALLKSIPILGKSKEGRLNPIEGTVPDPYNRPQGCPFHTRCTEVILGKCDTIHPQLTRLADGRAVRCLLYEENGGSQIVTQNGNALLEVNDLKMHFPIKRGLWQRQVGAVKAVDGVDFTVYPGETVALVGESGCGKTTIGRCLLRAYDPTGGEVLYETRQGTRVDLVKLSTKELKPYRRELRMIFQDPHSSLNPRMTVLDIVGDPIRIHKIADGKELEERVADLLQKVGLRPEYMRRYPHAFSGGQRQRIGVARALALDPRLVVADEAVSALDVSVQAQILNLLQDLQAEMNLTYLFISHDLSVVEYIADRVAVMYVGKLVELAEQGELYSNPQHPYTEALLSAVPKPDPRLRSQRIILEGDVPDPAHAPPSGCFFHPRCSYAKDICASETPELRSCGENGSGHLVACHFAEELSLRGIGDLA